MCMIQYKFITIITKLEQNLPVGINFNFGKKSYTNIFKEIGMFPNRM